MKILRSFLDIKKKSQLVRISKFWNNSSIKYERNGDRNKNLSFKECLDKIKANLEDIVINLQKSDT